jgi:hypothetical protein
MAVPWEASKVKHELCSLVGERRTTQRIMRDRLDLLDFTNLIFQIFKFENFANRRFRVFDFRRWSSTLFRGAVTIQLHDIFFT